MSTAKYKPNKHVIYYVSYELIINGEIKQGNSVCINPKDEESAIREATKHLAKLNITYKNAKITDIIDW